MTIGQKLAIIDASNVAWYGRMGKASLKNINLVIEALDETDYSRKLLADARLKHDIDNERGLRDLLKKKWAYECPYGTDADKCILQFAHKRISSGTKAVVVSNDAFRDYRRDFDWVRGEEHIARFMIIDEKAYVQLPERRPPGNKPIDLTKILLRKVKGFVLKPKISAGEANKAIAGLSKGKEMGPAPQFLDAEPAKRYLSVWEVEFRGGKSEFFDAKLNKIEEDDVVRLIASIKKEPERFVDPYPYVSEGIRAEVEEVRNADNTLSLLREEHGLSSERIEDLKVWCIPAHVFRRAPSGRVHEVVVNAVDGKVSHDLRECSACWKLFIPETLEECAYCGRLLCNECSSSYPKCYLCGSPICPDCWEEVHDVAVCSKCGLVVCEDHSVRKRHLILKRTYCERHA